MNSTEAEDLKELAGNTWHICVCVIFVFALMYAIFALSVLILVCAVYKKKDFFLLAIPTLLFVNSASLANYYFFHALWYPQGLPFIISYITLVFS